jgi:hypothetical protein
LPFWTHLFLNLPFWLPRIKTKFINLFSIIFYFRLKFLLHEKYGINNNCIQTAFSSDVIIVNYTDFRFVFK